MRSPRSFLNILGQFLKGKSTLKDKELIERWYSSLDAEHGNSKLSDEDLKDLTEKSLEEALSNIRKAQRNRFIWPATSAAAAIIIGGIFFLYHYSSSTVQHISSSQDGNRGVLLDKSDQYENKLSVAQEIWLRDSSRIVVQPGGLISVASDFGETTRKIVFKGEAFFDIKRNEKKPFQITSYDVVTTVLGTSFHVKAPSPDAQITVMVKTGKVAVARGASPGIDAPIKEVLLTPNQQATFDPGNKKLEASLVEHPMPLNQEILMISYEEELVSKILGDLESVYGISIKYDKVAMRKCRLTTTFSKEDLYQKLNMIALAIGGSYEIVGVDIVFLGRGC